MADEYRRRLFGPLLNTTPAGAVLSGALYSIPGDTFLYLAVEQIRQILMQEQDHQINLATALGIEVPDIGGGQKGHHLGKRR